MRSRDTRRSQVILFASAEGFSFSRSSRARMKLSISLWGHLAFFTCGKAGWRGGSYAQCLPHFAPASTQAFSVAFCAAVSLSFESGGGICSSGSSEKIRAMSSLTSLLPGTITSAFASCSRSSRSFALRALPSGPWHVKHVSERIGSTSRLKSTAAFADNGSSKIAMSTMRGTTDS